jgi:hypothetical protein
MMISAAHSAHTLRLCREKIGVAMGIDGYRWVSTGIDGALLGLPLVCTRPSATSAAYSASPFSAGGVGRGHRWVSMSMGINGYR